MNVSFYTIDDLRLPAKRLLKKGWAMERFSTLEAALSNYRALPDSGIKALGLTDGAHILEVVKCLPLFPGDKEGESVLASDYQQFPLWAQEPEAAKATVTCIAALRLRYGVYGNVLAPIPSPEGLPQELRGKLLWLGIQGGPRSAINRVYVAGRGWESPRILDQKSDPMALVLKYQADGITEQGAYVSLEVKPWEYELLALRTMDRLKHERSNEV